MSRQNDFGSKLATICTIEQLKARTDPERAANMIERQCNAIGMSIAMLAGGDPARAQELLTGMEQYIYDAVAQYSPLAKLAYRTK
jgi:hypothetical protein